MALRRSLSKRLFDGYGVTPPPLTLETSPISPPSFSRTGVPQNFSKTNFHREYLTSRDSAVKGFFRRFLQRRAIYQSPARLPEFLSSPLGDDLREKLRGLNISGDRIRFDSLNMPAPENEAINSLYGISVDDARKILKLSQLEKLKAKLRDIPKSSISYSEFVGICAEVCKNDNQGNEFAKMMDESGSVIVLGNIVFLRPEQVSKSMGTIISQSIAMPSDSRFEELAQMEKQKAIIDQKAKALVRGELYCGLGFILVQTLGFMRLTFWELSWDVMEPVCFFVTSLHFALCYGFFLRTSTEPSFEGYFQRRFEAKQKKLMGIHNFDVHRYNELRRACYPFPSNHHHHHNLPISGHRFSEEEEAVFSATHR